MLQPREALTRKEIEKTCEKMRDFKKSDFTENDVRSLININLQLIDIINNNIIIIIFIF